MKSGAPFCEARFPNVFAMFPPTPITVMMLAVTDSGSIALELLLERNTVVCCKARGNSRTIEAGSSRFKGRDSLANLAV